MSRKPTGELRRGWTTGACATAAVKAALLRLWGGAFPETVQIVLPRGETPVFPLAHQAAGPGWAEAGITKDAGDDPDVTHGCLVIARVREAGQGVRFRAGDGVGRVTRPGLPIPPGEPAINPVPRQMMTEILRDVARECGKNLAFFQQDTEISRLRDSGIPESRSRGIADRENPAGAERPIAGIEITIAIPGGAEIAEKTWNPRLGITGGLSVLGTTGVVRPFSCSAWIASIHRGIDVARAAGETHVAGCTGAQSEKAVQALYHLPDHAMLDMGDFAGGMLKYLRRHPVPLVTVGGGIAKMTKLAQGAVDLHSGRSQVDFGILADWLNDCAIENMNTVLQVYEKHDERLAKIVADKALARLRDILSGSGVRADVVICDRQGAVIARAGP